MEINYKGVLCRLGTYRVIGEDKPTLYFISAPDDETMYKAGFKELHYGLWGKILTDEEYKEITNIEVEKELNTLSNELISKMKKNKFKGTYKIIENNTIEWKIQENIRIEILVDYDDVIDFYYKDPSGNEHRHDRSDDYPHSNIMELLSDYNNSKFEVKELVDSVMNEVFYTILLGLDGETSLGDVQMQYKVYDETDNLLDGIESYAYDSFMNEE